MKTNKIFILAAVLFSFVFYGCSLDEDPKFTQNSQILFENEASAETVLMECYSHLAHENLYGQRFHTTTSSNGVYWGRTDGSTIQRFASFDAYAENDDHLGYTWQSFYKVIAESNYFIEALNRSALSEEYKSRSLGHAYFLRGYSFYMLANLFGQALVITDPITMSNLHQKLQPRENVYLQAEKDLIMASENLKDKEAFAGLAVKNTAIAFLAKLNYMKASQAQSEGKDALELWNKAKSYGDQLIGKFSLEPNYANLWKSHVNNSREVIFQLNYTTKEGVRNRANFLFGPSIGGQNSYAYSGAASWGRNRIDKGFYDFHRGTHPGDPRIDISYISEWERPDTKVKLYAYPYLKVGSIVYYMDNTLNAGSDPKNPDYDMEAYGTVVTNFWRQNTIQDKQLCPYNAKMSDINTSSGQYDTKNLILFRYADLLLLMADVENELDNPGKAVEYINQVLTRARNSDITGTATSPANLDAATVGKEALREFIFFERMIELAGEPVLFEDIRRRGTPFLKKVIEMHNNSHIINYRIQVQEEFNITTGQFREYLINDNNITEDFLKRNLLLPIPSSEINYNENLSQADQNFGY